MSQAKQSRSEAVGMITASVVLWTAWVCRDVATTGGELFCYSVISVVTSILLGISCAILYVSREE